MAFIMSFRSEYQSINMQKSNRIWGNLPGTQYLCSEFIKREYDESKNEIIKELKKEFRPELINRIDEIIVFHKLENREIIDIAKIMLKQIEKRLEEKKYLVKIDDSVAEIIANSEIDKNYGARPLRRKIQELVEDRLSEEILQENIVRGKEFIFKL